MDQSQHYLVELSGCWSSIDFKNTASGAETGGLRTSCEYGNTVSNWVYLCWFFVYACLQMCCFVFLLYYFHNLLFLSLPTNQNLYKILALSITSCVICSCHFLHACIIYKRCHKVHFMVLYVICLALHTSQSGSFLIEMHFWVYWFLAIGIHSGL